MTLLIRAKSLAPTCHSYMCGKVQATGVSPKEQFDFEFSVRRSRHDEPFNFSIHATRYVWQFRGRVKLVGQNRRGVRQSYLLE